MFSPLQCIHFESAIVFVFLTNLLLAQWERAGDPTHRALNGRRQFRWMALVFVVSSAILIPLLSSVSPLLGAELAMGFTLALLHPVNALCLFVHFLFLRPWEVMPDVPLLAALPRALAGICAVSWALHPESREPLSENASRGLLLLACFSLWSFLSTFAAPDAAAAQARWLDTYFKSLIVFVMVLFFVRDARGLATMKRTIVISVLGMVCLSLF